MNFKFNLIFVGFVINLSKGYWGREDKPVEPTNPLDMVTFNRTRTSLFSSEKLFNLHHAFTSPFFLWKGGQVNIDFDESFSEREKRKMLAAMAEIEESTCIRYKMYDETRHSQFVKINKHWGHKDLAQAGVGCPKVGGQQNVWFGYARLREKDHHYAILHEFLHTLGFRHHHARSDRDNYIAFHMENSNKDVSYLKKCYAKDVDTDPNVAFLTPFDFDSVMMYDPYSDSTNGEPFITSKIKGKEIPECHTKTGLSKYDKILINKFYKCPYKHNELKMK